MCSIRSPYRTEYLCFLSLDSVSGQVVDRPGQTLADLYDPLTIPPDLRRAHEKLDKAVDHLYRKEPFKDDRERLEFLLGRYGDMVQKTQKLIPEPKRGRRRAKRRA